MKNTCMEKTITKMAFEGFDGLELSYRINKGKTLFSSKPGRGETVSRQVRSLWTSQVIVIGFKYSMISNCVKTKLTGRFYDKCGSDRVCRWNRYRR